MHRSSSATALLALALLACACGSTGDRQGVGVVANDSPAPRETAPRWTVGQSAAGTWRVRWRSEPSPVPVNEPFRILVEIDPAGAGSGDQADVGLALDAGMPSHGHGMVRVPRVVRTGPGRFSAEGVLLHMPGPWEVFFDVELNGITERAQFSVEID